MALHVPRDPSVYTGHAEIGMDGVLYAELVCAWGSVTHIRGTPAVGGWTLAVSEVVFPPDMVVPWLDDDRGEG